MRSRIGPSRGVVALALFAAPFIALACFSTHEGAMAPRESNALCSVAIDSVFGSTRALVAIRNFSFGPGTIHVKAGTTVTWVNCEMPGVDPHTTTSDENVWTSLSLSPGDTFSFTFNQTGAFAYTCVPHPFMHGIVVVE